MEYLFTVIFGLTIGSFLNVCIYRIPRDGSISNPRRSYCPHCNHNLSALDNVPVFSYIFLRGKCRYCKGKISPRYMIVELLTMALFILLLHRSLSLYHNSRYIALELMSAWIFVGFLVVISFIDLDFTIIPDKVVYPGILIGFLLTLSTAFLKKNYGLILSNVLGAIIGAAVIEIIAIIGKTIFRREAMGMGDVKLMGMIGIYLGLFSQISTRKFIYPFQNILVGLSLTILISAFLGSIVGLTLILVRKKNIGSAIPFGPFLAAGAIISVLYGKEIWFWYRNFMGM